MALFWYSASNHTDCPYQKRFLLSLLTLIVIDDLKSKFAGATKMAKGWVYVMSNPAFNYLKIGQSSKDPQERASELSAATGVPMPYELVYSALVEEFVLVERKVHHRLSSHRVNNNREFFDCSLDKAVETIRTIAEKIYLEDPMIGERVQSQQKTSQKRATKDTYRFEAKYSKYFSDSRGMSRQPGVYQLRCPSCAQTIRVQMSPFFENHSITCNCIHCDWIGSVDGRALEIENS